MNVLAPRQAYWCEYINKWQGVKDKYALEFKGAGGIKK
jgi:hypothetical protein